jgi:hypothetical protein
LPDSAAESDARRIHSDFLCGDVVIAAYIPFASKCETSMGKTTHFEFFVPVLGRPNLFLILNVYKRLSDAHTAYAGSVERGFGWEVVDAHVWKPYSITT